ncbi:MAG: hypothetical protein OXG36_05470 [Caldilineaceae bacterium]|nr:hypothetical protein [Caldilineaceae bacterium]
MARQSVSGLRYIHLAVGMRMAADGDPVHRSMKFGGRIPTLAILPIWAALLVAACTMPSVSAPAETTGPVPGDPIVFSDLNWQSAMIQNRIAQYLVEKGYGHSTAAVFGATLPLFQGLRNEDVDVNLEVWITNQPAWEPAVEAGEVVEVGRTLVGDWQSAFVIPAYLQEQHPDLDSVEDLKDDAFKALFATAETGGKARLVSCMIGWACEEVNAQQVLAYGLDAHVHMVNPGDGTAANADLYGAYERGEPWLGYQWGTNEPALVLDLVRLEEPPYTDECWATTKACAYVDSDVRIAVHPSMLERAPEVVDMLRNFNIDIALFKDIARWSRVNEGSTERDAALWFLQAKPEIWSQWVTSAAAERIQAALDAGEAADGWPDQ